MRQRLIVFILVNTIQYPRTLKNNIHHSNKRGASPFFHSNTNPVLAYVLIHPVDTTHVLVVTMELISLLFLNTLSFNFFPTFFRRSYVDHPAVVLTNHTSYVAFLLDVRCDVQSGYVPFFCSCLSPMIVDLRNLFLLSTPVARILLTPRWVSK